ncbi:MAG: biosynthetic-type acetolactate synthase large subunit [Candidatus Marinimicrobia bacterium]|nr:biosynthetic-type acetolactate synthase large subunit [Candidatus Neomarinimicrobiota bacterium]
MKNYEPKRILTGAEIIWECLIIEGVRTVFGYPGGAILPTYDAFYKYRKKIHHVLTRHEQGATHMADGYARASGKVGVAMATSGPGATNMITGLATAMMDSSPIVCITGQVPRHFIGTDAFQETDITGAVIPVTKHCYLVMEINKLASTISEAFYLARTGRPGPILIDIPKDIQNESVEFEYSNKLIQIPGYHLPPNPPNHHIIKVIKLINEAKFPIIFCGNGVILSGASSEILKLAEKSGIPIATTLLGIGGVPDSHPLVLGMMGMHGHSWVNHAIQEADLIIACGMRFDDRVTGKLNTYSPNSKKIHIDIDASEFNKNVKVDISVHSDLKIFLKELNPYLKTHTHKKWLRKISFWRKESHGRDVLNRKHKVLMAAEVIREIWKNTDENTVIITDVGQHQMLEAQYYNHENPRTLLTSGGLGTMGFSLPAGIGASFHSLENEIWIIVGDGSIQMTITELATAVQENSNINIAIINNGYLGMVRQWQEMFYDARYSETPITSPDYVIIAEAYGLSGQRVTSFDDINSAIKKAQSINGPAIIEFIVEKEDLVYPMVSTGADLNDMVQRPKKDYNLKSDNKKELLN